MIPPVLEIRDLAVRYGARLAAWGVDLTVGAGEVVALVGESGAGKSTVGRAVVRLLPEPGTVAAGTMRFRGQDLGALPAPVMRQLRGAAIAFIPQDPLAALNPTFRLGVQATDPLRVHHRLSRRAAERVMVGLLARMHVADPGEVLRRYPHELSGGMRQRVLIAMAFSCEPGLVIADEPTSALDVTTQAQILRLLEELQAERAVATLFVTHDLGVVAHLAHRVAVLYAGCLVEVGPTARVFDEPAHPYTAALLAQVPRADRRVDPGPGLEGTMPVLVEPPRQCPFLARCPERLGACEATMPALRTLAPGHRVACHLTGRRGAGARPPVVGR